MRDLPLMALLACSAPQQIPEIPVITISSTKEMPPICVIPEPEVEEPDKRGLKELSERFIETMSSKNALKLYFRHFGDKGHQLEIRRKSNKKIYIKIRLPTVTKDIYPQISLIDDWPLGSINSAQYCERECIPISLNGPLENQILFLQEMALRVGIKYARKLETIPNFKLDVYNIHEKIRFPEFVDSISKVAHYHSK
jgi:hypothetical protein